MLVHFPCFVSGIWAFYLEMIPLCPACYWNVKCLLNRSLLMFNVNKCYYLMSMSLVKCWTEMMWEADHLSEFRFWSVWLFHDFFIICWFIKAISISQRSHYHPLYSVFFVLIYCESYYMCFFFILTLHLLPVVRPEVIRGAVARGGSGSRTIGRPVGRREQLEKYLI